MSEQAYLDEVVNSVLTFDSNRVKESTNKALSAGVDPSRIIEGGLTKGLRIVGEKFENGELFLVHLVAAAEASRTVMNELLEPRIVKSTAERKSLGKVVIGTVAGDIHDIGKNIVASMLFAAGFEVHDLGKDVPVDQFTKRSKEVRATIVASSALLTTTMPIQREIVKRLIAEGLGDQVKVMVGGAPVTENWAKEIGADGYAENAVEAVTVAKKFYTVD